MAKADIILLKNVEGLGGESDQVTVAAGYARNYLIPYGFAMESTRANRKYLESLKARREEREREQLEHASQLARVLAQVTVMVTVKTGEDGRMFGSVTSRQIVESAKEQYDIDLDRHALLLNEPIKSLGDHSIELKLHKEIESRLQVSIISENPVPPVQ